MKRTTYSFWHGLATGMVAVVMVIGLVNFVQSIPSPTTAWHSLQDVAKTSTDITSVDADADGLIDNAEQACGSGVNCAIDAQDVDTSQIQRRIFQTCLTGNAIRVVNQDGSVTCEPITGGGSPPQYVIQSNNTTFTNTNQGTVTNICPGTTNPFIRGCSMRLNITGSPTFPIEQWAQPTLSSNCTVGVRFGTNTTFTLTAYSICSS